MARTTASFRRAEPRFKQQARVLVLCEDEKSSLTYLVEASRYFRVHADVEVTHCGRNDPQGIVEEAILRSKNYEIIYCVIDRDGHQLFDQALARAATNAKVSVIASYPCYEFWLLLHFRPSRKPYAPAGKWSACDLLLKDIAGDLAGYEKGSSAGLFGRLLTRLPEARTNSRRALLDAHRSAEFNPSTRMHELIDAFEKLANPELLSAP